MIPAKADPEKQKAFLEQEIQPRLEEAQAGKRVVLFVDAAHFVLAPFLGFLWSSCACFYSSILRSSAVQCFGRTQCQHP